MRRYLAELLEEAAAAAPQPAVLQPVAACLQGLCSDGTASVAKRAVPTATAVFRTCFALVAAQANMLAIPQDSVSSTTQRHPSSDLMASQSNDSPHCQHLTTHAAEQRSAAA